MQHFLHLNAPACVYVKSHCIRCAHARAHSCDMQCTQFIVASESSNIILYVNILGLSREKEHHKRKFALNFLLLHNFLPNHADVRNNRSRNVRISVGTPSLWQLTVLCSITKYICIYFLFFCFRSKNKTFIV